MYLLIRGNSALPFSSSRRYPVGTGYIALYDEGKERSACCLCRILDREELRLYQTKKNLSAVCDLDYKRWKGGAALPLVPVVVLRQTEDVEEADKTVEGYRKGLEALEEFRLE